MKFSSLNYYRYQSGFTLIELLVVIAIIGVLASIVLASLEDARAEARDSVSLQQAKQLMTVLEMYRNDHGGSYPCANPSCTANMAAYVNPKVLGSGTEYTYFVDQIKTYYKPAAINSSPYNHGTIFYRIGGAAPAEGGTPNKQEYTISVRLESMDTTPDYCSINMGRGNLMFNGSVDGEPFDAGHPTYYQPCF